MVILFLKFFILNLLGFLLDGGIALRGTVLIDGK